MWVRLRCLRLLLVVVQVRFIISGMWMVPRLELTIVASYSYTAAGASHSVTCRVTDSASVPVTAAASVNAVSITVNPALVAPTLASTPGTVTQGQTSVLLLLLCLRVRAPYTYQWLQGLLALVLTRRLVVRPRLVTLLLHRVLRLVGTWSFELQGY